MRIFQNFCEAITEIARELKKCSSFVHTQTYQNKNIKDDPSFNTRELQGFSFAVIDTSDKDKMPGVTLDWAQQEFLERIDVRDINPGHAYLIRQEVWNEFLVNGKFDYTYNERIKPQLGRIIIELVKNPETRQAVIEIHSNEKDLNSLGGKRRIPCSMFYQFMIRDGKLDVIYTMRSTDFATHFQNDLFLAATLRDYIGHRINVPRGKFIFFASSLHIYQKDYDSLMNY